MNDSSSRIEKEKKKKKKVRKWKKNLALKKLEIGSRIGKSPHI